MSANLFMIYQINDLEKSRDYRCRPYEYQIENGFMVTSENYVLGYKASLIQGVTPGQIRERMEKLNPDRFRVRKFGVSDVIVTSIGGKNAVLLCESKGTYQVQWLFHEAAKW